MIVAQRQAAGRTATEMAELLAHRHAESLDGLVAGAMLGHVPATNSAFQCSATPNSHT